MCPYSAAKVKDGAMKTLSTFQATYSFSVQGGSKFAQQSYTPVPSPSSLSEKMNTC